MIVVGTVATELAAEDVRRYRVVMRHRAMRARRVRSVAGAALAFTVATATGTAHAQQVTAGASSAPERTTMATRPHVRGGIQFLSIGDTNTTRGGYWYPQVGLGFHLGVQASRLVGIYVSARGCTNLLQAFAEVDAIVDFTLGDHVQIGAGLGLSGSYIHGFEVPDANSGAIMFPLHLAVTEHVYHRGDARHGFQVALDLSPGVSPPSWASAGYDCGPWPMFDTQCRTEFTFTAAVSVGWEWF